MKIGIITFHSAHNYGAVLQAWSLQKYLRQQGHEAEIINLRLPVIDNLYRLTYKSNKHVCNIDIVNKFVNHSLYQLRCVYHCWKNPGKREKYTKFERFINKELPVTREFLSYDELMAANLQYDALIAGSDQIWNGTMMKDISPAYFLQFANRDALRISYAASIGTDKIPEEYQMIFDRYLRDFDAISVREKKAKEQVMNHTEKEVRVVSDPTFLLQKEDFEKIAKKSRFSGKYIYVHNVHLKRYDDALYGVAEELQRRLGIPVVHNWKKKIFANEKGHFTGGIEEFLGIISGAEYIVTNSFHCTVFAIIFHKNFITVPHYLHPDRMKNLLEELGISEHLIDNRKNFPKKMDFLNIDYAAVDVRKEKMGLEARKFLTDALSCVKKKDDRIYFECNDKFRCYGCSACKDICPADAIYMKEDSEGFLYPVVRENCCIHCGKCREVCIYHNNDVFNLSKPGYPVVYTSYNKDENVQNVSTSGGVFTAMYHSILRDNGVVVGVGYDDSMNVVYDLGINDEECAKFRGAKYVFADCNDIKKKARKLLQDGKKVLFTGTPCQIAGLKRFLGKEYENLITVDNICNGGGSPKVFRKYCDFLQNSYKSKIIKFEFHNKFKGADHPFVVTEYESGSIDVERAEKNNFSYAVKKGYIQRPMCYNCEFVGKECGVADITVGNYLGTDTQNMNFGNNRGVSVIKINTAKGEKFFETWKTELVLRENTYEEAYENNSKYMMPMPGIRMRILNNIDEKPVDDLLLTFNRTKKGGIKGI